MCVQGVLVAERAAGTGKSTLAGIVLDEYLRDMPQGEAVVILVPSRTLRDEHALNAHLGVPQILGDVDKEPMCSRVLWLGRAAEDAQIKAEQAAADAAEAERKRLAEERREAAVGAASSYRLVV